MLWFLRSFSRMNLGLYVTSEISFRLVCIFLRELGEITLYFLVLLRAGEQLFLQFFRLVIYYFLNIFRGK